VKKYWLLFLLLLSLGSAADTFFISNREAKNNPWENCCTDGVCVNRNWYQTPEIDLNYNYGFRARTQLSSLGTACRAPNIADKIVDSKTFVDQLHKKVALNDGRVLIFVHGYNVKFDEAMKSMNEIAKNQVLNKKPFTPLLFDWKSNGKLLGYLADEESVRVSALGFSYLIQALAKDEAIKEIHIVAHSMGNRVAVDGLERAAWMLQAGRLPSVNELLTKRTPAPHSEKLKTIAYFASDLDLTEYSLKVQKIHRTFDSLKGVIFYSEADWALRLSQFIHGSFARTGNAASGTTGCTFDINTQRATKSFVIPSIDLSSLGHSITDLIGHSYILRSPVAVKHLGALFSSEPFKLDEHYERRARPELHLVSDLIGCSEEAWTLKK
jgi:esterase/lipase superfamily enzyme